MSRILVIGESCTDEFIYCKAARLAPDYPVPVLQIQNKVTNPGMAANVFRNIQSRVSDTQLITNENWTSILKTRYVHEATNHMFLRVDSNDEVKSRCSLLLKPALQASTHFLWCPYSGSGMSSVSGPNSVCPS